MKTYEDFHRRSLDDLDPFLDDVLAGKGVGRTVVKVS